MAATSILALSAVGVSDAKSLKLLPTYSSRTEHSSLRASDTMSCTSVTMSRMWSSMYSEGGMAVVSLSMSPIIGEADTPLEQRRHEPPLGRVLGQHDDVEPVRPQPFPVEVGEVEGKPFHHPIDALGLHGRHGVEQVVDRRPQRRVHGALKPAELDEGRGVVGDRVRGVGEAEHLGEDRFHDDSFELGDGGKIQDLLRSLHHVTLEPSDPGLVLQLGLEVVPRPGEVEEDVADAVLDDPEVGDGDLDEGGEQAEAHGDPPDPLGPALGALDQQRRHLMLRRRPAYARGNPTSPVVQRSDQTVRADPSALHQAQHHLPRIFHSIQGPGVDGREGLEHAEAAVQQVLDRRASLHVVAEDAEDLLQLLPLVLPQRLAAVGDGAHHEVRAEVAAPEVRARVAGDGEEVVQEPDES
eukprot:768554-Hanusia_phi.AAC.5